MNLNTNNKKKNYIILEYNEDGYKITIHSDEEDKIIPPKKLKIMRKVLNKYKPTQINEDTYIYYNNYLITIEYKIELIKSKRKVNRKKSANLTLCIVLSAALAAGGYFIYNHTTKENNKKHPNNTEETNNNLPLPDLAEKMIKLFEETEKVVVKENTENNEINKTPIISKEYNTELKNNEINNQSIIEEEYNQIENTQYNVNDEYVEAFYYDETPGDQESLEISSKYDDIFLKYEKKYGVDAKLLRAIAAQESSGDHYNTNEHAFGLMGIEDVRDKDEVTVYNFETNQFETFIVDLEKVKKDIDYCVEARAVNFQKFFITVDNSNLIPINEILFYTLQRDNMGAGRMQNILASGEHWMDARKKEIKGDPSYPENVLSRLENGTVIALRRIDGSYLYTTITNTYTKEKSTAKGQ